MLAVLSCKRFWPWACVAIILNIILPAGEAPAADSPQKNGDPNPWVIQPNQPVFRYRDTLLSPGETFKGNIAFKNLTDKPQAGQVKLQLVDVDEQPVGSAQTVDITLEAKAAKVIEAAFTPDRLGSFKVEATVTVDGRARLCDVASFGVVPPGTPPRNEFFGVHLRGDEGALDAYRRLGYTKNRVHNMTQFTWWVRMEPERGQWVLEQSGAYEGYRAAGFEHLGQWFGTPYWAVTDATGKSPQKYAGYPKAWMPTDKAALENYVRESLRRFPGIKEWEIWNEPNVSMFWPGSPQDYVELCKTVYAVAKAVRPDITVYANIPTTGPWPRTAFENGLMDHVDGLSFHWYANANAHPQAGAQFAEDLRRLIAKYSGKDPKRVPIIQSEGCIRSGTFLRGFDVPNASSEVARPPLDFRQAAEVSVATRVVMMASGVKADYFYIGAPGNGFFLYDVNFAPKPKAIALCQLAWQLDGGEFVQPLSGLPNGLRAYLFKRSDGQTMAVVWAEDGSAFDVKTDATAWDLFGNPIATDKPLRINSRPIYLRSKASADAFASHFSSDQITTVTTETVAPRSGPKPPKRMDDFAIVAEVGTDKMVPLDLSAHVNMGLADEFAGDGKGGWTDEGPFNDLRMVSPGKQVWLGVPFILPGTGERNKSVVTFKGRTFPSGPESIMVDTGALKRTRALVFAYAAGWPKGKLAEYVVRYADGQEIVLPVIDGQNVGNWWSDQKDGEESRVVSFLHPDPQEPTMPYRFVRVWYWENARDVAIRSIVVRKVGDESNFVLLGITAAQW